MFEIFGVILAILASLTVVFKSGEKKGKKEIFEEIKLEEEKANLQNTNLKKAINEKNITINHSSKLGKLFAKKRSDKD
jgi:hypothetical protein